ncbi:DUF2812 domain-containing protein [Peptostreptococcus faecalis]|uniref:DUF2812 domain-containing protein n=1 Tax=Peptostreptococcus faecalis TaxID=2045015 RepID=UPI000C7E418D|nr:DUF2812 domain-containing protein [Peptostreptococcus faecalis]
MKKTIKKIFWVWQYEKEEEWLNEMASDGWTLDSYSFFKYTFRKEQDNDRYTVRLAFENQKQDEYIDFIEGTGAEYIGKCFNWMYFRKNNKLGKFELLSDVDSKIKQLKRIFMMLSIIFIANIINIFNIFFNLRVGKFLFLLLPLFALVILGYASIRILLIIKKLKSQRVLHE